MGWKEAINTYPSSIVYEIHDKYTYCPTVYKPVSISLDLPHDKVVEQNEERSVMSYFFHMCSTTQLINSRTIQPLFSSINPFYTMTTFFDIFHGFQKK
jgi:hypothetical protein